MGQEGGLGRPRLPAVSNAPLREYIKTCHSLAFYLPWFGLNIHTTLRSPAANIRLESAGCSFSFYQPSPVPQLAANSETPQLMLEEAQRTPMKCNRDHESIRNIFIVACAVKI